jgi:5'-3' exonuclease
MNRLLLIDSDIVAFKLAAATEEVFYFDGKDQPPAIHEDFEETKAGLVTYIEMLAETLKACDVIICLSDETANWRKTLNPSYKANRKGLRKPTHLLAAKDFLAQRYKSYIRPTLEADDVMGIISTNPALYPDCQKIIVSEDKDMRTIPGYLVNPRDPKMEVKKISRIAADRWHLEQAIIGDTTDGYPGCPGVGERSPFVARLRLAKRAELWPLVVETYASKGRTEHDAIMQARLARICRHDDYDYEKKEVILWSPNSLM